MLSAYQSVAEPGLRSGGKHASAAYTVFRFVDTIGRTMFYAVMCVRLASRSGCLLSTARLCSCCTLLYAVLQSFAAHANNKRNYSLFCPQLCSIVRSRLHAALDCRRLPVLVPKMGPLSTVWQLAASYERYKSHAACLHAAPQCVRVAAHELPRLCSLAVLCFVDTRRTQQRAVMRADIPDVP